MKLDQRFWFGFFAGATTVVTVLLVRKAIHQEDPDDLIQTLSSKLAALESNLGMGVLGDLISDPSDK